MQLRYLQALTEVAREHNSTTIFPVPSRWPGTWRVDSTMTRPFRATDNPQDWGVEHPSAGERAGSCAIPQPEPRDDGRHRPQAAVAHVWGRAFTGFPAWVLWLGVHLINLIGFRNRLFVLVNWAWDYFLYERAVRLILPSADPRRLDVTPGVRQDQQ